MDNTVNQAAPNPESDRPRPPAWEGPAIALGFLLAFAGLAWWLTRPELPETGRSKFEKAEIDPKYARYVGDRACRECHPGESAAHSRSGHSRTLRLASQVESARHLDGREAPDPERPDVSWRFDFRDGQLAAERKAAGSVERFLVEYAFGSRRHALTFVSLLDRDPTRPTSLEHRLTDFAHSGELGLTPGQKETTRTPGNTPHGREMTASDTLKCFECHTTALSNRGPTYLDEATMIANVSCERCHGPAQGHVEAARKGAKEDELTLPFGQADKSTSRQMKLCGECHRTPEMVTIGDIRVDNAALVRHQPVGLMQSACFKKSEDRLNCSTCHDPHARSSTDRVAYQANCLACHDPAGQSHCPVSPREGCVDCHMPKRDVGRGMMMSDHWIRIIPTTDPVIHPTSPRPSP